MQKKIQLSKQALDDPWQGIPGDAPSPIMSKSEDLVINSTEQLKNELQSIVKNLTRMINNTDYDKE